MSGLQDHLENEPSIRFGKLLAHPSPGEEVVVSGIAGSFPLSENIEEFAENLKNKVELITEVPPTHPELPCGFGLMKDISTFDCGFFGVHPRHAQPLNPTCKFLLEKCFEATLDAGLHPSDLEGTNTGLFLGMCLSEYEAHWFILEHLKGSNTILGNHRSVYANRISHYLKLKGPSFVCDTACSSSAYAMDAAYKAIRMGQCEAALVLAANFVLPGGYSLLFAKLGMLSKDGHCRPFDIEGNGYTRAEAASAILLQKAKDSKRIYARLVHTKTNCDGNKAQGITYPSGETQLKLLKETYLESGVRAADVSYLEAHATGTKAGDPEEVNSIDAFFTPGRIDPFPIGSVKSNMGHSEPASSLCCLAKVVSMFETGNILPTVNFKTPKKELKGILEGRIKIPVENEPFVSDSGLAALSCFGFGGSNSHAIVERHHKVKSENHPDGDDHLDLAKLVCVSGRTEEAVVQLLDDVATKFDQEHVALIHNIFRKPINSHPYRGYIVATPNKILKTSITSLKSFRGTFSVVFGGPLVETGQLLSELFDLPLLSDFKSRTQNLLKEKTLNGISFSASSLFVELVTQLAIAELLKRLDVNIIKVAAFATGKLTEFYIKSVLSLEEALQCARALVISRAADQKLLNEFENVLKPREIINGFSNDEKKEKPSPEELLIALFSSPQKMNFPKGCFVLGVGEMAPSQLKLTRFNLNSRSGIVDVLELLGRMYEHGLNPQIQRLYPKVEFPVSRGTPMISSKIKWSHRKKYFIPTYDYSLRNKDSTVVEVKLQDAEWAFIEGHCIDGRVLFPASGYLYLAWNLLSDALAREQDNLSVVFENCRFLRACTLTKTSHLELDVMLQKHSGVFEIIEGGAAVMTGKIRVAQSPANWQEIPTVNNSTQRFKSLNNKDIYKELRLRGYHYKNVFKSLTQFGSNQSYSYAKIKWQGNWIAFLDNMLQAAILVEDTRLLYVPTSIGRLTLDPAKHIEIVEKLKLGLSGVVEVAVTNQAGIIRSGGVEIRGLVASSIRRKKETALPVLEKYQFVPNEDKLSSLQEAVRVFMQLILENSEVLKFKCVELVEETRLQPLSLGKILTGVLDDQPLVKADYTVLSPKGSVFEDLQVENKQLCDFSDCTVVIGSDLLGRSTVLQEAARAASEEGYVISRESGVFAGNIPETLRLMNVYETACETLYFLRKTNKEPGRRIFVSVTSKHFHWLKDLKEAVNRDGDVIIWSQREPLNGLLGLVNCIRKEPGTQNVRCLFITGDAPDFDPDLHFYKSQLDKQLAVNVFVDGRWGTYRHLLLGDLTEIECEHCYANSTVLGDLSSIRMIQGPLTGQVQRPDGKVVSKIQPCATNVQVSYAALNFKDVMIASGRINADMFKKNVREQDCTLGLEFSGRTLDSGRRVMGMMSQGTLATLVRPDETLLWDVPDAWSLQDAATIPVVYATCLYGLVFIGKIKPYSSILIHSGTGGIGQAAITLCLRMGCTIFTTVGTEEKRDFLQKKFPQLSARNIGNSRDLSFEQMIMKETKGKGVDLILNSLAEEKLFASTRCLARNGKFVEIGKYDLGNDNRLGLMPFRRGGSYHGVMLDRLFTESDEVKLELRGLVQKYIDSGAVKPLNTTIFKRTQLEQAFRFMATGRHIGKVLVEFRNETDQLETPKGLPRYFCDPSKSYVICGGLGGFGLELADWLVLRGAKNLVLTSRKGISTGYQDYRVSLWESYGCAVQVSQQNITTKSGCEALIQEAAILGPVQGIFNLAVVLQDSILGNQTEDSFLTSFGPKAYATQYLDEVSRKSCPELRDFVVFSSVSCGRGNAGQTNYGMSNSVMERLCERRRREGYPALAIQWGAVGDVGLVAELQEDHVELEIGGTLQQSIASCLQVMDFLLKQNESSVVSSMVVAAKRTSKASGNIVETVGAILGIRDVTSVSMQSTLAEIGMDSMNAVEVKQTLEREYNILLSPNEIRGLTLARIKELQENGDSSTGNKPEDSFMDWTVLLSSLLNNEEQTAFSVKLDSRSGNADPRTLPKIIAFPGVEGVCYLLEKLTKLLEVQAIGINYVSTAQEDTFAKMGEVLFPHVKKLLQPEESFHFLAHSLGAAVALEVAGRLEQSGLFGKISFIDGSPALINEMASRLSHEETETSLIESVLKIQVTDQDTAHRIMQDVYKCSTFDQKLRLLVDNYKLDERLTESVLVEGTKAVHTRWKAAIYTPESIKLKSKATLYKPETLSVKLTAPDYDLGLYFEDPVEVKVFEGTHITILENTNLAEDIMKSIRNGRG